MEHVEAAEEWNRAMGAALRSCRGVADISQAEVERRTKITRSSYRLYERGERSPTFEQVARISRAFGIRPSDLFAEVERHLRKSRQ